MTWYDLVVTKRHIHIAPQMTLKLLCNLPVPTATPFMGPFTEKDAVRKATCPPCIKVVKRLYGEAP